MKLIIVRHGRAEEGRDEMKRDLTAAGSSDIVLMSRLIAATGWNVIEIRSSPLLRTRRTAEIIVGELKLTDRLSVQEEKILAPGVDLEKTISLLERKPNSNALIWVFHAPDVSRVAAWLTGNREQSFYFPAGAMAFINLTEPEVIGQSMLISIMQPEFMRGAIKG